MDQHRVLYSRLKARLGSWNVSDPLTRDHVVAYLANQERAPLDEWRRRPREMFWPPRVVEAVYDASLNVFFGSGISLAAGAPDWMGLLKQVGLDADVERDPTASGDLLTLAELAAHLIGADPLQSTIRNAFSSPKLLATTAHYLLAALHLPLLITTNYDRLFEDAFKEIHGEDPTIITNDLDVKTFLGADASVWDEKLREKRRNCFLVKLHGSVSRPGEHLILTRSDYRRHYRANTLMLDLLKRLLLSRHTLFLGFSHRDPEVARIIEDVIYGAQTAKPPITIPGFYSLQFDMLQKTPEIFAARGIVALQPPLVLPSGPAADVRGASLSQGLADLFDNTEQRLHQALSLDADLRRVSHELTAELERALNILAARSPEAITAVELTDEPAASGLCERLVSELGEFANQGAYLVGRQGTVVGSFCPPGLDSIARRGTLPSFEDRPYFRLAQSNRESFVSDVFESGFNRNSTLAACKPLLDKDSFVGLLFAAFQLGEHGLAKRVRALQIPPGSALLITDANGVLVLPPAKELDVRVPSVDDLKVAKEDPAANIGYPYWDVLQLSRRDKRIDRLMQNIVPLSQDDDVYPLASDTVAYSVVTELGCARWKVALSRFLRIQN